MSGYRREGRWAPTPGAWLTQIMEVKMSEILCNDFHFELLEVFALAAVIENVINEWIAETPRARMAMFECREEE